MDYRIIYHPRVEDEDIPALPDTIKQRVLEAIVGRLMTHPAAYGKPLRRTLAGYRKLRIGDWRLIYRLQEEDVKILIIGHRSKVYESVLYRL